MDTRTDVKIVIGKLHELEALANYLQTRLQYEIGQNSSLILTDKSLECLIKASVLAIDLTNLIKDAKAWMVEVNNEKS